MAAQEYQAPESIARLQNRSFAVAIIAILAGIIVFFTTQRRETFYETYLMSYMWVLGLALGSLGLLMLYHLTSGLWGVVIRRPLEAATRTIPLLAVLFLPIIFGGMNRLYSAWLDPEKTKEEPLSHMQQDWLTHNGFVWRALIYFLVWAALIVVFNSWSRQQDTNQNDRMLRRKFKLVAGPGIILYVFGISFAAIDWVMSISPHWASTIYGFLFVAGQLISSMSLMIAVVVLLSRTEPFASVLKPRQLHDLSKLLFAFILLWAYFDFSQLLIIWSGNQPEEISFYRTRLNGEWGYVAVIVLLLHFFVPFFVLLSSDLKKNKNLVPKVAIWMIFIRLVDLYWMTRPEFTSRAVPGLLDFIVPIALLSLWLAYFAWNLRQWPLLPLGEPKLPEVIGNHEH